MAYGSYGVATARTTTELNLFWGGDRNKVGIIDAPARTYASTLVDAGNTPTSDIDAGLLLAEDGNSELVAWNPDLAGADFIYGVCPVSFSTLDESGTAIDMDTVPPPILRAPLVAASLSIEGTALVGDTDEYMARAQLHQMGCILDDDPQGKYGGGITRTVRVTGAGTDTLAVTESGTRLIYSNAAAVTAQLPAAQPGVIFDIIREGDESIVLNGTSDLIIGDSLAADTVTFTTANEHIGARLRVEGIYVDTTALWLVTFLAAPLGVGLDAWTYGVA